MFPVRWEEAELDNARQYSRSTQTAIGGSYHRRAAGGIPRRRYLSAQTYSLGPVSASIAEFADMAAQRIGEAYRIVERYEVPGKGVYLTAYRFRHSGDPVTQAAIVFLGANGDAYLLEVPGHQDDETFLLGEARQIARSVSVGERAQTRSRR